jgi:hypothetical protein
MRLEVKFAVGNGNCAGCWDSIHHLVKFHLWEYEKVSSRVSWDGELADGSHSSECKAGSWTYIWISTDHHQNNAKTNNHGWNLYIRYAVYGVCCTWCHLIIMAWGIT